MQRRYHILSLFPEYFVSPFSQSIIKRAREKGLLEIETVDIRDFAQGPHRQVDDRPFGGGPGMVLMAPPVAKAIRSVRTKESHVIYLSPQGKKLDAKLCRSLAKKKHLVLLCGHYEGVDERVIASDVDEEVSIGDYVLPSGCPAAVVLLEAVARFIPGVLGHEAAATEDSFEEEGIFDCPHYTHPRVFEGREVPEVLLSGHHENIWQWRRSQAREKTAAIRPDLMETQNETGEIV